VVCILFLVSQCCIININHILLSGSLASTIVPGLKTLMSSLELKHPDIAKEIKYHLQEQAKLASLSDGLIKWLRTVLMVSMY
jgi:hypothetical protein